VRPHLERMRDVGLLMVEAGNRGTVGRPQHLYSLAPDAPSLGLEPPTFPMLARLLVELAATLGPDPDRIAAVATGEGQAAASRRRRADGRKDLVGLLVDELSSLGFDPAVAVDGTTTTVAFTHCPF
jgi:predicted ArsR family transcriptional regulator